MAAPRPVTVAVLTSTVVAVAFAAALLMGLLRPATLVWTGPLGPSYSLAVQDFGPEHLGTTTGLDGQQYYAIAAEFPHLDRAVPYLDSPRYRMLRILEPAIASLAPRGTATILTTLALNVLAIGIGAFSLALLAPRVGLPTWVGYAAGATLLTGTVQSTPDPLACALALLGVAFTVRSRHGPAVAIFVLAVMTRETMVVVPAVCGLFTIVQRRSLWPGVLYALPGVAIGSWYLYLGTITTAPFLHEFEFLGVRSLKASELALIVVFFALTGIGMWRWRHEPVVAAVAAVFGVWMLVQRPDSLQSDSAPRIFALAITPGTAAVLGYAGNAVRRIRPARVDHGDDDRR